MENESTSFQPIFQVSEFNEVINKHLSLLGEVTIEGELTRLDIKNGKLIFGAIKDKTSSLDIFSMSYLIGNFRQFEPGMLVRVTGTAGVYKGTTKFRLFANSITPQGEGALQIAFEKLKIQLEAEGLFAPERKRPLPEWPTRIGLITAKDSSAYFDLVKILTTRTSGLLLTLFPVSVQGRESISSILKAFKYANLHSKDFDVLIMARGGGSLEDLMSFNSEEIARAVFSSKVPIVSAIGHEDNWSLTDYIADLRASTPSNAAELVVRDRNEVIAEVLGSIQIIKQILNQTVHATQATISESILRIESHSNLIRGEIDRIILRLQNYISQRINLSKQDIDSLVRLLNSLDYQQTLNRGFSITKNAEGKIVKSATNVKIDELLTTQLAQGIIKSRRYHD